MRRISPYDPIMQYYRGLDKSMRTLDSSANAFMDLLGKTIAAGARLAGAIHATAATEAPPISVISNTVGNFMDTQLGALKKIFESTLQSISGVLEISSSLDSVHNGIRQSNRANNRVNPRVSGHSRTDAMNILVAHNKELINRCATFDDKRYTAWRDLASTMAHNQLKYGASILTNAPSMDHVRRSLQKSELLANLASKLTNIHLGGDTSVEAQLGLGLSTDTGGGRSVRFAGDGGVNTYIASQNTPMTPMRIKKSINWEFSEVDDGGGPVPGYA